MIMIALNVNEYKPCEFCTISPTSCQNNLFTLKVFLIFELAIHLICSINLKKKIPDVKVTKINDGGTVFRSFMATPS